MYFKQNVQFRMFLNLFQSLEGKFLGHLVLINLIMKFLITHLEGMVWLGYGAGLEEGMVVGR